MTPFIIDFIIVTNNAYIRFYVLAVIIIQEYGERGGKYLVIRIFIGGMKLSLWSGMTIHMSAAIIPFLILVLPEHVETVVPLSKQKT